jgi:hypothetical protein
LYRDSKVSALVRKVLVMLSSRDVVLEVRKLYRDSKVSALGRKVSYCCRLATVVLEVRKLYRDSKVSALTCSLVEILQLASTPPYCDDWDSVSWQPQRVSPSLQCYAHQYESARSSPSHEISVASDEDFQAPRVFQTSWCRAQVDEAGKRRFLRPENAKQVGY